MKLLIGGSPSKIFHLKEFSKELEKGGIKTKLVIDSEIYDGFPSRNLKAWLQTKKKFNSLINNFNPDIILVDRQRHFGLAATKLKIPVFVHVRGDFWNEMKWAKETLYKSFPKRIAINKWENIANQCFENASAILPICKFLENRTKENYPNKITKVMYQGINPNNWQRTTTNMKLKHPCVGLLQSAVIWGKAQEMLILKKVLTDLPKVNFYWAGDGPYRNESLDELSKFENFHWLGNLQYPDKVREFLSEIDIYALISGIDMSPLTLQEAQLMKKPVIATSVGGIPELMQDKITGYLVKKGNPDEIIEKISLLLYDKNSSNEMGTKGRFFIEENFSWPKIAQEFLKFTTSYLEKN